MSDLILCVRCGVSKPRSAYYDTIATSWCIPCRRAYSGSRYAALTPEQRKEANRVSVIKRRARLDRLKATGALI